MPDTILGLAYREGRRNLDSGGRMEEESKWDYYLKGLRAGLQIGWSEARLYWLLRKEVPKEFPQDTQQTPTEN